MMFKKLFSLHYHDELILEMMKASKSGIFIGNILAPFVSIIILYTYIPTINLLIWSSLNIFLFFARHYLAHKLKESIAHQNQHKETYLYFYVLTSAFTAMLISMTSWGSIVHNAPDINIYITAMVITVLTAGSIATLGPVFITFFFFMTFAIFPTMTAMIYHGGIPLYTLAAILSLYYIIHLASGYRLYLAQRATLEIKQKFQSIYNESSDGIAIIRKNKMLECNKTLLKMFKYEGIKDFYALDFAQLTPKYQPDGQRSSRKVLKQMQRAHSQLIRDEWVQINSKGEVFWAEITLQSIMLNDEEYLHATWRDISDRKEVEKKLQELNETLEEKIELKTAQITYDHYHDKLTGLENLQMCKEVLKDSPDNFVIITDISDFSSLNKLFGKEKADEILQQTANSIKFNISNNMRLFRGESDRFIIYVTDSTLDNVKELCQNIFAFFDIHELEVDEQLFTITFNMGISAVLDTKETLINAEFALDASKKIGTKTSYVFNADELNVKEQKERMIWMKITRELIEEDLIMPYYQPIKNIKEDRIYKYEVLARAYYDEKIIAPYLFLDAAKRLGLITTITRIIIDKSFAFFQHNDHQFSINLTEMDLKDGYLIEFLKMKSARYNMNLSRVTFEVLENIDSLIKDGSTAQTLHELKQFGCQIAIDDFGVENSNFLRLLELDFDYLKLDGVFIKDIAASSKSRKIVEAVVNLSKTMGIKTVAEFVENEAIYTILKEIGVDYAQGYYIAKPAPELLD